MHVVIRKDTASPAYVDEVRPTLARLVETMRALPGFVAYSFVETDEGIATGSYRISSGSTSCTETSV